MGKEGGVSYITTPGGVVLQEVVLSGIVDDGCHDVVTLEGELTGMEEGNGNCGIGGQYLIIPPHGGAIVAAIAGSA